jgi:hypothetical protein
MRKSRSLLFGMFFLICISLSFFSSAYYSYSNPTYSSITSGDFSLYAEKEVCEEGQDFLLQLSPLSCSPAVVRSDLLAEQNVPVFCPISAIKINPMISVEAIESLTFFGNYPPEVSGVGFHPARSALGGAENINTPFDENIGYAVIVLKKQSNESALPDFVKFNLSAKIRYDIKDAFGVGQVNFLVPELTDDKWNREYPYYGFWNSKGFLKTELIEEDSATISVYFEGNTKRLASVKLKEGETSSTISIPGWDCLLGVDLRLNKIDNPDSFVTINVNSDVFQLRKGGKFLDNKCSVRDFEKYGLLEKVDIYCREDDKPQTFSLTSSPKFRFSIGGVEGDYEIGDRLPISSSEKVYYLAFVGGLEKTGEGELVETNNLNSLSAFIYEVPASQNVGDKIEGEKLRYIASRKDNELRLSMKTNSEAPTATGWLKGNKEEKTIFENKIIFSGISTGNDVFLSERDNYDKAIKDYQSILESYAFESFPKDSLALSGQRALEKQIELSNFLQQKDSVRKLCEEFFKEYSEKTAPLVCSNDLLLANAGNKEIGVTINGRVYSIGFDKIVEPSFLEYGIEINVDNIPYFLKKDEKVFLRDITGRVSDKEYLQLEDLSLDEARVRINFLSERDNDGREVYSSKVVNVPLRVINNFGTIRNVYLNRIYLKKIADISVLPSIENAGSESKFGVAIGIEQRAVKLAPEWVRAKINNLNKSIEDWEDRSEKLGTLVKGMKTACLSVGAILTISNFLSGMSGESLARKEIMNMQGGWKEKCAKEVAEDKFPTIDACYLENSKKIEEDVGVMKKYIDEHNERVKKLQAPYTKDDTLLLGERVVDDEKFAGDYFPQVRDKLISVENLKDSNGKEISLGEDSAVYGSFHSSKMSISEARKIDMYSSILKESGVSESLKESARKELSSIVSGIEVREKTNYRVETLAEKFGLSSSSVGVLSQKNTRVIDVVGGEKPSSGSFPPLTFDEKTTKGIYLFQDSSSGNTNYLVTYNAQGLVEKTYKQNSNGNWEEYKGEGKDASLPNPFNVQFNLLSKDSYSNTYKAASGSAEPVVRYHEAAPYQGLPAVVPFDTKNGWYAATKNTLPVFGKIASYEDSGRVSSFWVCNVGSNGREEFSSIGDDICQQINTGTGQPYNIFPGLSSAEANKIIKCGQEAIEQASRAYKGGISGKISIKTSCAGSVSVKVGEPALDIPQIQCQDIMSPEKCNVLFNVCDPVICPSSRCNLGGSYPVKDVVQSGIIGSLVLCFPNFKLLGGDVWIPVCLTGLKAGIDGLISVMDSYRSCLQKNLDDGEMVGICDEIYSIHLCEFFWRQGLPLAKIALPRLFGIFSGQNVRGGGEYLTVQAAWDSASSSVDYFTKYYADNAWKSFASRMQDGEQVGTEVCKNFASANYGIDLDILTDPDSPPQFHGKFDEIPFTTATNPPTSQYKVFYHIYAGKDSQVYYRVYLKGSPDSSYYQDASNSRLVDSGYIAKGDYVSETKDFTSPTGHKEICINVNGQEECGFKQVSSSFAVDYVKDSYMKEIADERDISSERDCVSGKASLYSALNPNIQEGASEMMSPAIYNRGVIRICATENPGRGTDGNAGGEGARWVDVGNCGNEKIRCWVDSESVKKVIHDSDLENETLESLEEQNLDVLKSKSNYLVEADYLALIKKISNMENPQDRISSLTSGLNSVLLNSEKAYLLYLRGNAYGELAKKDYQKKEESRKSGTMEKEKGEETNGEEEILTQNDLINGKEVEMREGDSFFFDFKQETHSVNVNKINERFVEGEVASDPQKFKIEVGNKKIFSFSENSFEDLEIKVVSIFNEVVRLFILSPSLSDEGSPLVKKDPYSETEWTYDSAIKKVRGLNGKYSENKEFVDALYNQNLIKDEQYNKIKGWGILGVTRVLEKDMNYVGRILEDNQREKEKGGLLGEEQPKEIQEGEEKGSDPIPLFLDSFKKGDSFNFENAPSELPRDKRVTKAMSQGTIFSVYEKLPGGVSLIIMGTNGRYYQIKTEDSEWIFDEVGIGRDPLPTFAE